jgi:hypothetical protein
MKKYINMTIAIVFLSFGCHSLKTTGGTSNVLEKLFLEQKKLNPVMAENFAYSRRKAIETNDFKLLLQNDFDTLWLIERADEVDMSTSSVAWTSFRDVVVLFEVGVDDVTLDKVEYKSFEDPLKSIVEKFDTVSISTHESPLGAKRVFISEISKQKIRTYYFTDIIYK